MRIAQQEKAEASFLWENLTAAIRGKMKVVREDPYETSGVRQILNLGHTMGHVLELLFQISQLLQPLAF